MKNDYEKLMAESRQRVEMMDKVDRENGMPTPSEVSLQAHFETAIEAIKAGVKIADWGCVTDGLVIFEQFVDRLIKGDEDAA